MKYSPSCPLILISLILNFAQWPGGFAAVTLVDSFDQAGFSITHESGTFTEQVTLPFGNLRSVGLTYRGIAPGTIMTSMLDSSSGKLTLFVNGTSTQASRPLSL